MRNHDEKLKEMAESVLPSTARVSARRDRRAIHHAHRARQRAAIHAVRGGAEFDEARRNADRLRARELGEFVWDRRAADKIGSLTRWALATVRRDPALRDATLQDQVDHFAALLPDNLIGRHAVEHIRFALEWEHRRGEWTMYRTNVVSSDQLAARVRTILAEGRHGELNARLRELAWARDGVASPAADGTLRRRLAEPPRLLLGLHDVDGFVADVIGSREVREAIEQTAGR